MWQRQVKAFRIGILAGLFGYSSLNGSSGLGHHQPPPVDCQGILLLISQLAATVSKTPFGSESALKNLTGSALPSWSSDWISPIHDLTRQLEPHFEFVRFADSTFLLRVTQLELQEIGIRDPKAATAFFAGFGNLSNDKQLAFVNGILFRVLWEVSNHFSVAENSQRLKAYADDNQAVFGFVGGLKPSDYHDLSLRLLCHYGFRAQSFSERLAVQWSGERYEYPNEVNGDWIPLHGFFLNPVNGARLVEDRDWVPVLDVLFSMGAHQAAEFFVATHLGTLPESVLIGIEAMPALPPSTRAVVVERLKSQSGSSNLSAEERKKLALIAASESELAIVETRIALQTWVDALAGMGNTSSLVAQLKAQLAPYVSGLENQTCGWVFSSVQYLLRQAGFAPDSWAGQIVGGILSQVLISVASSTTQAGTLHGVLEDLYRHSVPIAAFASELSRTGQEDLGALRLRQQALAQQLASLRGLELLQGHPQNP